MAKFPGIRQMSKIVSGFGAALQRLGHRIHDSQAYAFAVISFMGLCSSFFFTVVLNVLPAYFEEAEKFGLFHAKAALAIGLLLAIFLLAGGCLVLGGVYFGRLVPESTSRSKRA